MTCSLHAPQWCSCESVPYDMRPKPPVLRPKPAPVIGWVERTGFVTLAIDGHEHDGGDECARVQCSGVMTTMVDQYPPHPRGMDLRAMRLNLQIGLRDGAKLLGLTAVQLGKVERGESTLTDDEWVRAHAALMTPVRWEWLVLGGGRKACRVWRDAKDKHAFNTMCRRRIITSDVVHDPGAKKCAACLRAEAAEDPR